MPYSSKLCLEVSEYHAVKKKEIADFLPATAQKLDAQLFAADYLLDCLSHNKPIPADRLLLTAEQHQMLRKKTIKVSSKAAFQLVNPVNSGQQNAAVQTPTEPTAMPVKEKADSKADLGTSSGGSPIPSVPYTDETVIFPAEDAVWIVLHQGKLGRLYQQAVQEYRKIRIEQIFKTKVRFEQQEKFVFSQTEEYLSIYLDLNFKDNDPRVEQISSICRQVKTDDTICQGCYSDPNRQLRRRMTITFYNEGEEFDTYPFELDEIHQKNLICIDFSRSEIQRRLHAFERSKGLASLTLPQRNTSKLPPIPQDSKDLPAWRQQVRAIESASHDAKSIAGVAAQRGGEIQEIVVAKTNAIAAVIKSPNYIKRCLFAQFAPVQRERKQFVVTYSSKLKGEVGDALKSINFDLQMYNQMKSLTETHSPFSSQLQQKLFALTILLNCLEAGRPVPATGLWVTKAELDTIPKVADSKPAEQIWACFQDDPYLSNIYKLAVEESRRAETIARIQHIFERFDVEATISENNYILQITAGDYAYSTVKEIIKELGQYKEDEDDYMEVVFYIKDHGEMFKKHPFYQSCDLVVSDDLIYCDFSIAMNVQAQANQKSNPVIAIDHTSPPEPAEPNVLIAHTTNAPEQKSVSAAELFQGVPLKSLFFKRHNRLYKTEAYVCAVTKTESGFVLTEGIEGNMLYQCDDKNVVYIEHKPYP